MRSLDCRERGVWHRGVGCMATDEFSSNAVGLLEVTGLTPAMVAIDTLVKAVSVKILQVELNDLYGICIKLVGPTSAVETALEAGRRVAERMQGAPVSSLIPRVAEQAGPVINSPSETSPLIQQAVVFTPEEGLAGGKAAVDRQILPMNQETPMALGFIETQGFTAVFEAIDTACKAASVEVVGKEKLGGGYVTVVVQGELSAVSAAIDAGREKVEGLGKLIAAHVIARPSPVVMKLLSKV
jgi:carbon dioxide concentrating mechanism protein CcmO